MMLRGISFPLVLICACSAIFAAEPLKFTVSKETTYITEPLGEDGMPDYRLAWLERLRKQKVPASENGAVDYWQTVGLESVDEKYRQAFCDELGMAMPKADDVLEMVDGPKVSRARSIWYLNRMGVKVDEAAFELYEQQFPDAVMVADMWPHDVNEYGNPLSYPANEVTPLTEWLARNNSKLDRIVAALDKPGWYGPAPSLCAIGNATELGLRPMEFRGVANSLATRSRISLDEGDAESAVRDLIGIHRLGDNKPAGLWIDLLLRTAGKRLAAAPVELYALEHPQSSDRTFKELQGLHSLNAQPSLVVSTLMGDERICGLNYSLALLRKDPEVLDWLGFLDYDGAAREQTKAILEFPIDADHFMRIVNQRYDQMAAAIRGKNPRESVAVLQKLLEQSQENIEVRKPIAELTPRERAEALATSLAAMSVIGADSIVIAEARDATHSQLMHLALALGRYRIAEGQYPDSLAALVPRFVPELPADAFGNDTFGYRKTDQGFLLYSHGLNGVDDGGSHHDMEIFQGYTTAAYNKQVRKLLGKDDPGKGILNGYVPVQSDDIAIRVPLIHVPLPGPDHG